ncbi:hypothetical protein GCM10022419_125170 [Nonomuraea rosea]|uniref:Uncharacterized protein n=1 Tax=Nonomuraea rosea TaxID=638574 RepID=A0ABP6ZSN0_9ACTN
MVIPSLYGRPGDAIGSRLGRDPTHVTEANCRLANWDPVRRRKVPSPQLIEHWLLIGKEPDLLTGRTGPSKLALALWLKGLGTSTQICQRRPIGRLLHERRSEIGTRGAHPGRR